MEATFSFPRRAFDYLPIVRETGTFTLGMQHVGAWVRQSSTGATVCYMSALPTTEPVEGIIEQSGTSGVLTFTAVVGGGATVVCRGFASTLVIGATGLKNYVAGWKWDPVTREFIIYGDVIVT